MYSRDSKRALQNTSQEHYLKLRLKVVVDWPKVQSLGYLQVLNVHKRFHENPYNVSRILCSWFRASLIKFLMIVQRDATLIILFIILQVHSTCFGYQPHPSSAVHKTVTTASGTVQLPPSSLATLEGGSCTVPEAVVTVLCTPDDGCGWHPEHVEWTCRIINRLLCFASRWTIIKNLMCGWPCSVIQCG